jgi:hypothetical protein
MVQRGQTMWSDRDYRIERTAMNETVPVRVLLLIGDQAEIVADAEDAAPPVRYPAALIADALGVAVVDLPGCRMLADADEEGRLSGWRQA